MVDTFILGRMFPSNTSLPLPTKYEACAVVLEPMAWVSHDEKHARCFAVLSRMEACWRDVKRSYLADRSSTDCAQWPENPRGAPWKPLKSVLLWKKFVCHVLGMALKMPFSVLGHLAAIYCSHLHSHIPNSKQQQHSTIPWSLFHRQPRYTSYVNSSLYIQAHLSVPSCNVYLLNDFLYLHKCSLW